MLPGSMLPYFSSSERSCEDNQTAPAPEARVTGELARSTSNGRTSVISGDIIQRQSLTIRSRRMTPPENHNAPGGAELPESSVERLIRLDEHHSSSDFLADDMSTHASLNEIQGWRRVNPFSPTMTGEWLADVLEQHLI